MSDSNYSRVFRVFQDQLAWIQQYRIRIFFLQEIGIHYIGMQILINNYFKHVSPF